MYICTYLSIHLSIFYLCTYIHTALLYCDDCRIHQSFILHHPSSISSLAITAVAHQRIRKRKSREYQAPWTYSRWLLSEMKVSAKCSLSCWPVDRLSSNMYVFADSKRKATDDATEAGSNKRVKASRSDSPEPKSLPAPAAHPIPFPEKVSLLSLRRELPDPIPVCFSYYLPDLSLTRDCNFSG